MSLALAARSLNACKSFKVFPTVTFGLCVTALSVLAYPLVLTQFLQWPRIKIMQGNSFLPVTLGTLLVLCVMEVVTENGNLRE